MHPWGWGSGGRLDWRQELFIWKIKIKTAKLNFKTSKLNFLFTLSKKYLVKLKRFFVIISGWIINLLTLGL